MTNKPKDNFIIVDHINGYLMPNAPDIYVMKRATPFFNVPEMIMGSMMADDGNFKFTPDELDAFLKIEPSRRQVDSSLFRR